MSAYLFVRHRVEDVDQWLRVFRSHAEAQTDAGFEDCRIMLDLEDSNVVTCMFRVEDLEKARAFTETPEAEKGKIDSGVVGEPEALWLQEI